MVPTPADDARTFICSFNKSPLGLIGISLGLNPKYCTSSSQPEMTFIHHVNPKNPEWDLTLVLESLKTFPLDSILDVSLKLVFLQTAFFLAITSAKTVAKLHALGISKLCLHWCPDDSRMA